MMATPPADTDAVRAEVLGLLERSPAYQALAQDAKAEIAHNMSKVGTFLADKGWLTAPPRAQALADQPPYPIEDLKGRMAQKPGQVGSDFRAGAVREGVEQFGEMVRKVDFPKFVGGLIQNVFQAVVDASIQQMRAFGELLAATAKTVDQFAQDNITDAQARDHIANRYPSAVRIDTEGEGAARLRPVEGNDAAVDFGAQFGLGSVDLTDDESEQELVNAAKLDMARSRQQLMATMVLLGINRIVVTDGHINAKVVFDMRASDEAKRHAKAELHDRESDKESAGTGWITNLVGGADAEHEHETTVGSAIDDTSESKASVKAQLSGDVRLAFKSETFPLERMVDVMGMQTLNQKATPTSGPMRPRAAAVAPAAAPAPPAVPAGGTAR